MPDRVGHTLGQYRIVEQIGLGGMATVYKAYQPALDRYVAIKILPAYYAHEPGFAGRFTREARAVAKLAHPHVLPIYDFGQENDLSYIVMQYVDAGTLKDMLGQPSSLITAADISEQIADALDYAHDQGIIHRDVKPSNVLMDRGRWVLLSDFGLAKMVEGSVQLTGSGVGVGTPAYMAPEQGQGLKVDRRADIYSLGIILYEMVTGRVPFEAETPMAVVVKHITEPLPLPHTINPELPESIERIIMKALAKNPEDRYATAGKMAAALRKAVAGLDTAVAQAAPSPIVGAVGETEAATVLEDGGATQVVPPPAPAAVPKRKGLPIWAVGVGVVLLLLLLIGGFTLARLIGSRRAQQAAQATSTAAAQPAGGQEPSDASGGAATPGAPPPQEPRPGERPAGDDAPNPIIERALAFAEQNPPLFEDDFSRRNSGWRIADDERGRLDYEDGSYVMQVPEVVGERNTIGTLLPFAEPLADFVLQLDLTTIEGGPGANWAVGFRAQSPDDGLYAGLSTQPRGFGIGYAPPDGEAFLERGVVRDYRPSQMTEITLAAIGPDIELYLDGRRVGAAHTDLVQPGHIFFRVINTGDPAVAYRFDNVRVWDLGPVVGGPPVPPSHEASIFEDFEDGRADGWDLEPGWKIVQEEDGNHVLLAERHSNAIIERGLWGDFILHFRAKPLEGDLLLNFRGDPKDFGRRRYMARFMPDSLVLHKFQEGRGPSVADAPIAYTADEWHEVDLMVRGRHIDILLDNQRVLTYDDPDPLPPGIIAFENGDPPAHQLVDNVVIEAAGP